MSIGPTRRGIWAERQVREQGEHWGRGGTLVEKKAETSPESIFIISAAAAAWLDNVKGAEPDWPWCYGAEVQSPLEDVHEGPRL